jgi:hypothetical protein
MKKIFLLFIAGASIITISCSREKADYIDLRTGKTIEVDKDPVTGVYVNRQTKEPVYIYVDTKKKDTIYGKTGAVINGHVVKRGDTYMYDDDLIGWDDSIDKESKYKSGDYKEKIEADGDVKIKDGDKKTKIDGETGEKKVKD